MKNDPWKISEYKIQALQKEEDAERIIQFFFSTYAFTHIWAPGEKEIVSSSIYESIRQPIHHQYWFVKTDEMVIAAIGVKENKYKSGGYELADDYFAVHVDYRRNRIDTALMRTMEAYIEKQHGRYIHIETCDIPTYEPARKLYINLGYKQVGAISDYYNSGE